MPNIAINILIGVIGGIITEVLIAWVKSNFMKTKESSPNQPPTKKYIQSIKRQFYICFPIAVVFLTMVIAFSFSEIIEMLLMIASFFALTFSLFAFMCLVEVVKELYNADSNDKSNK